jgi:hypothetical protein
VCVCVRGGIGSFWRGLGACFLNSWRQGLTEAIFELLRRVTMMGVPDGELGARSAFALGWTARALATCMTFPALKVRTLATMGRTAAEGALPHCKGGVPKGDKSVIAIVLELYRRKGFVGGFFSGLAPEMVRAATLQAVLNMVKEHATGFNTRVLLAMR